MNAEPASHAQEPPFPVGTIIGGRYRIDTVISLGGTSYVYRATDTMLGRAVALKIILRALIGHASRFEREARAMSALEHPAVVRIYGMGMLEDNRPFLVLEFVPGETLGDRLKRDVKLSPKMAAGFLAPVVGALTEAHDSGICHRDVKPDNMIIQPMRGGRPTVRVLDFGIAGIESEVGPRLTRSGQIMGTPEFMAPEQAAGEPSGEPADVWACGVVLYQMLMGHPPFRGKNTPEILYHLLNSPFPDLDESIPKPLRELIKSCLAKAPADRPAAVEVLGVLEGYLLGADTPTSTGPHGRAQLVRAPAKEAPSFAPTPLPDEIQVKRSPLPWVLLGILLGGAGGYFGAQQLQPPPSGPQVVEKIVTAPPPDSPVDAMEIAEALLKGDQAKGAVAWIAAKTPDPSTPRWRLLEAVATLRAGYIRKGLELTTELVAKDPEVRGDPLLVPSLISVLRYKRGDTALPLLTGALSAYSKGALRETAISGRNERARGRAMAALETLGEDVRPIRIELAMAGLDDERCPDRREALNTLVELKASECLPKLRGLVDTPNAKCLGDALPAAIASFSGE